MSNTWTVKDVLSWIEGYLGEQEIASPQVSARWLVSDVLGVRPIDLFTDLDRPLSEDERALLREYTRRRGTGEPLQYITGSTDFRFVTLDVEQGVLIPRPETEVLVSEAILELRSSFPQLFDGVRPIPPLRCVDLCTGSGNIACSLAHEFENALVVATDIASQAQELAQRNARKLGLSERVHVHCCDLASLVPPVWQGCVHLVISNPPYIPTPILQSLDAEVADFEPALALDGGRDGLDVFRRIVKLTPGLLCLGGVLAVELHETCLDAAASIARTCGFERVRTACDLTGRPRVLLAVR